MNETLLVIDDNENLRENTVELLELAGYQVLSAQDGKQGLEIAQQTPPALILCDIMMPELDGYGVLQAMENIPKLAGTPFVFMTSKSEKSDFRKGMDLGADDYLVKPFEGNDLIGVVAARLKKNEKLKQKLGGLDNLKNLFKDSGSMMNSNFNTTNYKSKKFKKKEIVFYESDTPMNFYFVLKGKVKTFKTNEIDRELITGIFVEGDFFGYSSLLDNAGFKETAETMEDSELAMIPKEEFFQLIYTDKELSLKFIRLITNNLAEAEQKLITLAYNSARKKVADAILYLRNKYAAHQADIEIPFTAARDDLSAIAGIVPESVSRNITDFKNEKLIESQNGKIKILNLSKLQNMKN